MYSKDFYQFQSWLCPIELVFGEIDSLKKGASFLYVHDTVHLNNRLLIKCVCHYGNQHLFLIDKK